LGESEGYFVDFLRGKTGSVGISDTVTSGVNCLGDIGTGGGEGFIGEGTIVGPRSSEIGG